METTANNEGAETAPETKTKSKYEHCEVEECTVSGKFFPKIKGAYIADTKQLSNIVFIRKMAASASTMEGAKKILDIFLHNTTHDETKVKTHKLD
jgi:hypothetical protein